MLSEIPISFAIKEILQFNNVLLAQPPQHHAVSISHGGFLNANLEMLWHIYEYETMKSAFTVHLSETILHEKK